jgi:hypothetical protein
MPFVAEEGDCPSAPSRAPGCGVHWNEVETLDGRSGRIRRRITSGKADKNDDLQNSGRSLVLNYSDDELHRRKSVYGGNR